MPVTEVATASNTDTHRDTKLLVRTSSTSHPPMLTPRTFSVPYGKLGLNARAAGRRAVRTTADVDTNMTSKAKPGMRTKVAARSKHDLDEWMPSLFSPMHEDDWAKTSSTFGAAGGDHDHRLGVSVATCTVTTV